MSRTKSDSDEDSDDFDPNNPFDTWKSSHRYSLGRMIGRGSYGEVVEATDTTTRKLVAIKRVQDITDSILDAKRIYREIHILRYPMHTCSTLICILYAGFFMQFFLSLLYYRHTIHPNVVQLLNVEAPRLSSPDNSQGLSLSPLRPPNHLR